MTVRIMVDGYNLMFAGQGLRPGPNLDLERAREDLLRKLSRYLSNTGHKMVVVFDGSHEGGAHPRNLKVAGIEVVFSRSPLEADDVIGARARRSRDELIVVTSDRKVISEVERAGCTSISSAEFMERIEYAELSSIKGDVGEEERPRQPHGTKKKGNPRRLPKRERKRRAKLNKL